jgi:hypothetical protein
MVNLTKSNCNMTWEFQYTMAFLVTKPASYAISNAHFPGRHDFQWQIVGQWFFPTIWISRVHSAPRFICIPKLQVQTAVHSGGFPYFRSRGIRCPSRTQSSPDISALFGEHSRCWRGNPGELLWKIPLKSGISEVTYWLVFGKGRSSESWQWQGRQLLRSPPAGDWLH